MVVVDASVLAKLFLQESGSDIAADLVARNRILLAPDIARLEVASAITRSYRNGSLTPDGARLALAKWRRFQEVGNLALTPLESLMENAEELSLAIRHPLADCLYLALAVLRKVPLITADRPFVTAARPHFDNARHLMESGA